MSNKPTDDIGAARSALAERIYRWTKEDDHLTSDIPGLMLIRYETPTEPKSAMYEPCICLVAQGAKRVQLGNEEYIYDENHMLITSVGLPVMANITKATKEAPLLSLVLKIDLGMVAQLMVDSNLPAPRKRQTGRGMAVCEVSEPLIDGFQRLIDLLDTPEDIPILSPLILKEITYRLLMGELGPRLRQIATAESHGQQVARAVDWLKENYAKRLKVEDLAKRTGMSVSTFHNHFRAVMKPGVSCCPRTRTPPPRPYRWAMRAPHNSAASTSASSARRPCATSRPCTGRAGPRLSRTWPRPRLRSRFVGHGPIMSAPESLARKSGPGCSRNRDRSTSVWGSGRRVYPPNQPGAIT